MISLGGVIGQGLFLSAGANLNAAGKFLLKKK
jgi:amino acid permease